MKKLLLISINSRFTHSNPVLRYLRNISEECGHMTEIAEYTVNMQLRNIIGDIHDRKPDVLAVSVYVWNTEMVVKLLCDIKKVLPGIVIICGGPEMTYGSEVSEKIADNSDFVIKGPGETAFELLAGNNFSFDNKVISLSPRKFSEVKFPYRAEDFDSLRNRFLYYESSRGCPFHCTYCLSSSDGIKLTYRKIDDVRNELSFISENYTGTVKFIDRTFNALKKHSREIWKYILEMNDENTYHFEIYPEYLGDEDFSILKQFRAGKVRFEMGIQSIHEKTLDVIKRKTDIRKTEQNIRRLKAETAVNIHLDMIAGLPGETVNDVSETFNFLMDLHPDQCQLGFLKVLPGTEMYEKSRGFGIKFSAVPPYTVYATPDLGFADIRMLENIEAIVDRLYNSGFYSNIFVLFERSSDDWFTLFRKLSMFLERNHPECNGGDWNKNCAAIKEFVSVCYPEISLYFHDCARLDYFRNFYSPQYPQFLKNSFTDFMNDNVLSEIKRNYESDPSLSEFVMRNEFGKLMFFMSEVPLSPPGVPDDLCLLKIRRQGKCFEHSIRLRIERNFR